MIAERDATRDRFLCAIADRVDRHAIAEAHLFQPIKQGGTESGIAVVAVAEPQPETRNPQRDNLVVYTARYRLTLRGPERGKWDFSIQAEADAPLVTVDKVVQGVQRRSGDAEGPTRMSGEEFRALLPQSAPDSRLPTPNSQLPTSS